MGKVRKVGVLILIVGIIYFIGIQGGCRFEEIVDYLAGIGDEPLAPLIYIFFYVLAGLLTVPSAALTALAGPLFGLGAGFLYAFLATNIAAQVNFFIARRLGRDFVKKFIRTNGTVDRLARKVEENGVLTMFYLRFPLMPYNTVSYLAGLTDIRYKDYAIGSFLGKLPGVFINVYITASAINILHNPRGMVLPVLLVGVSMIFGRFVIKKHSIKP